MAPFVLFADAAAVVIGYLSAGLAGAGDDVPVRSRVPNPRPARFVLVRRVGGPRADLVRDLPLLAVEAWGESEGDATDLLNVCRGLLGAMRGTVQSGVAVYRVNEVGGPGYLPDPSSDQPRMTMTVEVGLRGAGQ